MTIWFTSDTHFGHANIIKFCERPWATVGEMNEGLIERWNARVQPGDTVYHLGDVAFMKDSDFVAVLKRLNGDIHLVEGNHDGKRLKRQVLDAFASVQPYLEITPEIDGSKQKIVLFHYPIKVWNGGHHGSWHLFGHTHGTLEDDLDSRSLDVGVDSHDYAPISLAEVAEIMATKQFVALDYHQEGRGNPAS